MPVCRRIDRMACFRRLIVSVGAAGASRGWKRTRVIDRPPPINHEQALDVGKNGMQKRGDRAHKLRMCLSNPCQRHSTTAVIPSEEGLEQRANEEEEVLL